MNIRGMIKLTKTPTSLDREGPVFVQPRAITFIQPVKNGCKIGIAFSEPIFVLEGIDTIKRKLEGDDNE